MLVDGDNGIIAGHGRVLAAHRMGMPGSVHWTAHPGRTPQAYIIADHRSWHWMPAGITVLRWVCQVTRLALILTG